MNTANTHRPIEIKGRWREGFVLDYQTLPTVHVGDDDLGQPVYRTDRTETGELLYRLKNQLDRSVVPALADAAAAFVKSWKPGIDAVVAVPPPRSQAVTPTLLMAEAIAQRLHVPYAPDTVAKMRDVLELMSVYGFEERMQHLAGAFVVDSKLVRGRRILLFDDLFRSGATLNAVAAALYDQGGAAEVFALAITRTRGQGAPP
ncbi:MAG: ComF family protein [Candidatus Lambdaproteobacteria bacterium]|nr:ComF family protein [Candidatus Lambdaproteobacteria bacterium]